MALPYIIVRGQAETRMTASPLRAIRNIYSTALLTIQWPLARSITPPRIQIAGSRCGAPLPVCA